MFWTRHEQCSQLFKTCYVGRQKGSRILVTLKMSRNVQNSSMSRSGHFTSSDLLLSGICYVGKETKILGDAEDVLEEEDAEISFPGSLVSDCLPVLHENFSTFSQTKKKIYSIVVICYSIEREVAVSSSSSMWYRFNWCQNLIQQSNWLWSSTHIVPTYLWNVSSSIHGENKLKDNTRKEIRDVTDQCFWWGGIT